MTVLLGRVRDGEHRAGKSCMSVVRLGMDVGRTVREEPALGRSGLGV